MSTINEILISESDRPVTYLASFRLALLSADAAAATACIDTALAAGLSPSQVYLTVLLPAQLESTKRETSSELGAAYDSRSTRIALAEMSRLRFLIKPLSHLGVKAAVASIDGDENYLGARVMADYLLMDGWIVHFLGSKASSEELCAFAADNKLDLLGITASNPESLNNLRDLIRNLKGMQEPPKVILGGDAVYKNLDKVNEFGSDGIAYSAEEAVSIARSVCGISEQDSTLARYLKSLGERVSASRKSKKFSQTKLAEISGLDRAYISSVENGKQNVTIGAIVKLSTALGLSLDELLRSKE
jgi:methanogenic corrinoid protein MtbC1/DNA-binding XRE family transcriptional regulator